MRPVMGAAIAQVGREAGLRTGGARVLAGLCVLVLPAAACERVPVPAEYTLAVEEMTALGLDGGSLEEALYEPNALGFDLQGNLFVLDAGNDRVQVFAPDGSYQRTLGRPGEGPGELSDPEDMWVAPDGEVVVADAGNLRLVRFGAAGEPLGTVALEFLPIGVTGNADRLFVLRLPSPSMIYGPETTPLVQILDRDGAELGQSVEPEAQDVGILHFLANTLRLAPAPGNGFAAADMHVYGRVRRFDRTGAEVARFGLLYKADAWAPLGTVPSRVNDEALERVARTSRDIHWDGRRNLYWVVAGTVDRLSDGTWVRGTEVYRYDAQGGYRGTVPLPVAARRLAAAPDGTVWILDEDGFARRYRLRDPDASG